MKRTFKRKAYVCVETYQKGMEIVQSCNIGFILYHGNKLNEKEAKFELRKNALCSPTNQEMIEAGFSLYNVTVIFISDFGPIVRNEDQPAGRRKEDMIIQKMNKYADFCEMSGIADDEDPMDTLRVRARYNQIDAEFLEIIEGISDEGYNSVSELKMMNEDNNDINDLLS